MTKEEYIEFKYHPNLYSDEILIHEELISEVNGMALPDDYLAFIREHNGGEGPFGEKRDLRRS